MTSVPPTPWLPKDMAPIDRKEAEDNWADIHLRVGEYDDDDLHSRMENLRRALDYFGGDRWTRYWRACYAVLVAEAERRRLIALERTDCPT